MFLKNAVLHICIDTDAVSFGKSLIYLSSAAGTDSTDNGADSTGLYTKYYSQY